MSLTLERMRILVRRELGGLDSSDIDDPSVDELLNMSLWALEDTFPFKCKEQNYNGITLVEGTRVYSLSGVTRLDSLISVSIRLGEEDNYQGHKLARMTRDWLDANFVDGEDTYGLPTRYLRHDDDLIVFPTPSADYEDLALRLVFRQSIASLTSGDNLTTGLPRNWDEIVVAGATWRGHKQNGDYNIAQQAMNFQLGLIRGSVSVESKEERDSRYARVDVIHEFPEDELQGHEG